MSDRAPLQGSNESPEAVAAVEPAETQPDEFGSQMTELVEVAPNVVAVLGSLPAELELVLEPLNTGLLTAVDHQTISSALTTVGASATVGGNLAQAAQSMQGLYRMADESQALLRAGGRLAAKDGQNLGSIIPLKGSGKGLAQARFTPINGLNVAQLAASAGPALAMIALQTQLNEVSSLVQKNIELTNQVIQNARREERARLNSLIDTVDRALQTARTTGAVPPSLWDTVASKGADLRAERGKYQATVQDHVARVRDPNLRRRREYMQSNAETIVFDAFALLSSLKAWIGYQGLVAAVARQAGETDPVEARHFDSIVAATRHDWETDLEAITELVSTLTRELRVIVELRGPNTLKFSAKRKDVDAARQLASAVLRAIAPLAEALAPAREALEAEDALCAPADIEPRPYLDLLRWLLDEDERLRVLGIGDDRPAPGRVGAAVGAAKDRVVSTFDRDPVQLVVAVTDRRILTASSSTFLSRGLFEDEIDLVDLRYVRSVPADEHGKQHRIDVVTRRRNYEWYFTPGHDSDAAATLGGVLAQSMALPEEEREALVNGLPQLSSRTSS